MKEDAHSSLGSRDSGLGSLQASARWWLLAALLLLPLMITNDSLWLDEGDTAMYVRQPDFHAWLDRLEHDRQADCQMPLAFLYSWACGKVWGAQEWQLRAVNLLWGALALAAMSHAGRRLQLPWLPLLLAIQPYLWFYLNEARPYALQLAAGAWLLAALVEFYAVRGEGTVWAWQLGAAGFVLFCATMLAPLPVAATVFAGAMVAWREDWKLSRKALLILAGGFVACVPVAVYYLSTLMRGAKGAEIWHVDLKFFAYVVYELAGMGGIGLSAAGVRELARAPHLSHALAAALPHLALPALLALGLAAVLFLGLRNRLRTASGRSTIVGLLTVPALTAGLLVVVSLALQKAFWARHYAPVFPFYVALLGIASAEVWAAARWWWRAWMVILAGLLMVSSLNFRFAPSLRKEDYRAAAAFVQPLVARGESVWWLAGGYAAEYYGLNYSGNRPEPGKLFAAYLYHGNLQTLPPPAAVVCSRPAIHDPAGTVRKIMAQHDFQVAARFQSFVIWTNAVNPVESQAWSPDPGK